MKLTRIRRHIDQYVSDFRHSLAYIDALPQLTFLGALVGLFTGGIIILFRLLIELPLNAMLPVHSENFEALSSVTRVIFIMTGIVLLGIFLQFISKEQRETSVAHVLDRLHNYQGQLPVINWIVQFIGAVICIVSGQSVGREGPAVHLGAGSASLLSRALKLPHNSTHTLIACGVAASISASFDTPMAGVIFAMEVIVMEYSIIGFVPVILASVIGSILSQAFFGDATIMSLRDSDMKNLLELPYMMVGGLIIAVCASIYIKLNIFAIKANTYPIMARLLIAGLLTCLVSVPVPEVLGLGYDTLNQAIGGQLALKALLIIAVCKLLLTPVVIGLGLPGGVIGPLLVIGACIGGAMAHVAGLISADIANNQGFYVILGMTGMMAAALNAPLAALATVLELSYNPNMIFPAMLIIVIACVTTRSVFGCEGLFMEQLKHSGRDLKFGPATQALKRAGVRSIMSIRFLCSPQYIDYETAKNLFSDQPLWLVIQCEAEKYLMRAADLAHYLESAPVEVLSLETKIDLLNIPGRRYKLTAIHESANLYEALQAINATGAEALFISKSMQRNPLEHGVTGIVTRSAIENHYQPFEFRDENQNSIKE